jgi:outer membrane lipopolysaccharide assembly protein LptE/RlpB
MVGGRLSIDSKADGYALRKGRDGLDWWRFGRHMAILLCCAALLFCQGCGYQMAGKATKLPPGIKTIAVPTFSNSTAYYPMEVRLTRAVINEFITRTKYRITSAEAGADAVIAARINSVVATPVTFNPSGRASTFLINMSISVAMTDPSKKTIYYQNKNFTFREEYEISSDPKQFFQEDSPALERLSRQFAQTLVSGILENF